MLQMSKLPDSWYKPLGTLFALIVYMLLVFQDSWGSIVNIWIRSDTFAHGFLVAPASLWLAWGKRAIYKNLHPESSYWGMFCLFICGFLWLAGELSSVLVVEQFALVGMLICIVWAILGNQIALALLFPLLFLFLMVPFGDEFIPYLVDFTANFVVVMLRFFDISVYQEGNYLTLTTGQWSVVEACSGIRYLIASITLGLVYAYLNYTSYLKRTLFCLISVFLPILANGLRAFMIVMIGHLSDMKLATGIDHIIYGWLFFGLVMLLLFFAGSFWQDSDMNHLPVSHQDSALTIPANNLVYALVVSFVCVSIWPLTAAELNKRQLVQATIPPGLVQNIPNAGNNISTDWIWNPRFSGVMAEFSAVSDTGSYPVKVYFANFGDGSNGGELINSQNLLVSAADKNVWRQIDTKNALIPWRNEPDVVEESVLTGLYHNFLVMRWYRIGNQNTANRYFAKWLQFIKRLTGDARPELMVVIYTELRNDNYDQARERLTKMALACCR